MVALTLWTLALVVGAAGFVVSFNSLRFARSVAAEAGALWSGAPPVVAFERARESELPPPVRRYLQQSAALGREPIRSARLRHAGTITLKPDAEPLPIRGEQYFSADPPGFVWWGRVGLAPGVWIDARDKVVAGQAGMRVVFESTKTIQNVTGPQLDAGALVRVLGEMTWFPTSFLDRRYISWSAIEATSARATLRVSGREVSAVFHFGPAGMPERFTAERYRDFGNGQAALTPFTGVFRDWREVDGLRVPFAMEATWMLDGKPYTFARFAVEQLELDRAEAF